ncbi:magnesium chelatase subunit D [Polymorphobacter fuscus]|uniref:Magnesium chelatase subunit D n=1 Tax=Sandarakinorhabdus fusca TaxID=1439888 RepID=A0A7C9LHB4_9SPHN|nr:magnesium chelatase subunit D [Polymorphobacter fuscus]KAB7644866.1 magnesium chelatase subunit D [Polymorphobacter fuscus]MQT18147.1 magnesium chelatase subunit D [Polymorphobacter fuscus]NJC09465.1 magnesium chelatase subunit D [Polymorphobacter fuscus]
MLAPPDAPEIDAASAERWALALRVVAVLAGNPAGVGGVLLRARPGPVRDLWGAALGQVAHVRRLPASADGEALDGGLDLTATLAAGRPVTRRGLLAELGDGPGVGVLLVPMAERLAPALAARLASALDDDGPLLVLFDESLDDGEDRVSPALADRLAIHLDLSRVRLPMAALLSGAAIPSPAPAPVGDPTPVDDAVTALATAAVQLGIASIRAPIQAQRVAHALARIDGRSAIANPDLEGAAALVLGPRARQVPQPDEPETAESEPPPEPPPPSDNNDAGDESENESPQDLTDMVVEAAETALPPGLLDALANGIAFKAPAGGSSGAKLRTLTSGRPAGVRAGAPGRGARLALIETIKAAAPWQKLRGARDDGRLSIRHDDLRIRRYVARAQSTTVFAVDASGSAAFARLSEAKGAIELLLAQAYVKRAEVALVAFRGQDAAVTLPPTRSLARAKKELAALAGGGGTPIAAGLDLARWVAEAERARGRTPLIVILTDGRANVGGDATRSPHEAALASARALGATGIASVFIDCSARPRPEGAALAAALGARFVALPRLDAKAVVAAVNSATVRG